MSFGNPFPPRRRLSGGQDAAVGLVSFLSNLLQARRQRQEQQKQDALDTENRAWQKTQQGWATQAHDQSLRDQAAAPIEAAAQYDPENATSYLAAALAKSRGVAPPAAAPSLPSFLGLGGQGVTGAASAAAAPAFSGADQHQRQDATNLSFITGIPGLKPGRTPQQLAAQAQLTQYLREQADKRAMDERNFQQQEELARYQHGLGQSDKATQGALDLIPKYGGAAAIPALRNLFPGANFGPPSTPDQMIPGIPASMGPAPVGDTGGALAQALRQRLKGGTQTPNLLGRLDTGTPDQVVPGTANPLESLPVSPEVTARIGAQKAAEEDARARTAAAKAAEDRAAGREPYVRANIESQIGDRAAGRQQATLDRQQRQSNSDRQFSMDLQRLDETRRQNDQGNAFRSSEIAIREAEARAKQSGNKGDSTRIQALKTRAAGRLALARQLEESGAPDAAAQAKTLRGGAAQDIEAVGSVGIQRGRNVGKDGFDDFDRALIKKLQGSGMPYLQAANAVRNDKASGGK